MEDTHPINLATINDLKFIRLKCLELSYKSFAGTKTHNSDAGIIVLRAKRI